MISLYPYLEGCMNAIGGPAPKFARHDTGSMTRAEISFDSRLIEIPVKVGERKTHDVFVGEDSTPLIAKNKAVLEVIEYLRYTHGVEVHDNSHQKLVALNDELNLLVPNLHASIARLSTYMSKYQTAINLLIVLVSDNSNTHAGACSENLEKLKLVSSGAQAKFDHVVEQIDNLENELSLYFSNGFAASSGGASEVCLPT